MHSAWKTLWALVSAALVARADNPVREMIQENRLVDAAGICRQYEGLSGESELFLSCAWAYYRLGKIDLAERAMERVRRGYSSTVDYQLLQVYAKIVKKQYPSAREDLTRLQDQYKSGAPATSVQELSAELYEIQGQLETAAFIYKQLLSDDPRRARAHWGLARYYIARAEPGKARTHLEETARLWKRHLGSRYNLAVLALNDGNTQDAARWLTEAYKIDRGDVGVLEQIGILMEKRGKLGEAIKYWKRALEINKDATLAKEKLAVHFTSLIDTMIESGDYSGALARLAKAKTLFGADPTLYLKRATVYLRMGRYQKAVPDFRAYLAKNPKDAGSHRELGICYLNLKLLAQAGQAFVRALELEPSNGMNYAWVGFILERKKEYSQALEAWRRAAQYLEDPAELAKANRKVSSLEKKLGQQKKEREENEDEDQDEAVFNENIFGP